MNPPPIIIIQITLHWFCADQFAFFIRYRKLNKYFLYWFIHRIYLILHMCPLNWSLLCWTMLNFMYPILWLLSSLSLTVYHNTQVHIYNHKNNEMANWFHKFMIISLSIFFYWKIFCTRQTENLYSTKGKFIYRNSSGWHSIVFLLKNFICIIRYVITYQTQLPLVS